MAARGSIDRQGSLHEASGPACEINEEEWGDYDQGLHGDPLPWQGRSTALFLNKEVAELGLKKEDCKEMTWIESALWMAEYEMGVRDETERPPELDTQKGYFPEEEV